MHESRVTVHFTIALFALGSKPETMAKFIDFRSAECLSYDRTGCSS
jgi:hypothetical protein